MGKHKTDNRGSKSDVATPGDEVGGLGWPAQRTERIDKLLLSVERRMSEPDFKVSVGDFIRLLQLRKELAEVQPHEVTVKWVEPSEPDDASAR